jgi:hypothetical protein
MEQEGSNFVDGTDCSALHFKIQKLQFSVYKTGKRKKHAKRRNSKE